MFLVVIALAIGIALGLLLTGGKIQLQAPLRAAPALALGGLGLVVAEWLPVPGRPGIFIVATVLTVIALTRNLPLTGAVITAFGLFLTGFVVVINGYLPVRAEAIGVEPVPAAPTSPDASPETSTTVGATEDRLPGENGLRTIENETTTLRILGDVVPFGPFAVSFGDLIAAAGALIIGRNLVRTDEILHADQFLAQFGTLEDSPSAASPFHTTDIDLTNGSSSSTIDLTETSPPIPDSTRQMVRANRQHDPLVNETPPRRISQPVRPEDELEEPLWDSSPPPPSVGDHYSRLEFWDDELP